MPTIDLGQVVGPAGKSAYQYAVDGGYTGTEAEFGALLADAASKTYVDTLFNRVAPVIVTVQVTRGSGSDATVTNHNVKCYPAETGVSSYSINFSFRRDVQNVSVKVFPPEQYAFTGLYESSGMILESPSAGGIILFGIIMSDGYVWFPSADSDFYDTYTITGSFTLEVA